MVEHKTGTLNGYTGDVGFLTYPDGHRIAVVFFARGGDNRPAVISTAARAIYDGFGGAGQGLAGQLNGRVDRASTWQQVGLEDAKTEPSSQPSPTAGRRIPGRQPAPGACTLRGSVFAGLC